MLLQYPAIGTLTEQQARLLRLVEDAITEYTGWQHVRIRIRAQIMNDFRRCGLTQEQACDWIEDFQVFAIALHDIAARIIQEADEVTDEFHTWLTD